MDNRSCIIFDIDGTLVDSMGVWAEADRIFLGRHGIPYSPELSDKLKVLTFEKASEYIRDTYSLDMTVDEVCREITQIVRDKYAYEVPAFEGTKECLQKLRDSGARLCAATANSSELALTVLEANGILGFFEFVLTCEEAGAGKDSPDFFREVLYRLGCRAEEAVLVDDSPHSLKTAYEMDIFTIGICSSGNREYEEVCLWSDEVCGSVSEIFRYGRDQSIERVG